ncbi:LPS biosynthesis transferase [Pedobacter yulinensis]|uniref:LPS biosynthesis transferase n=1 Tax=Pedobacter yulinensis TaxID=2126353 RepID=A0A2T3HK91_9SPHI|nr:glycosyltransferase family 4 protein [Pedobacter yulinensis]PST82801.1 LPS biosynthesis transferase [Pedobacter yulinensis]
MKIFTWHIHGSYLFYLSQGPWDIYIPVNGRQEEGYYGRGTTFPFGANVHEIPIAEVRNADFDLILFQTEKNYLEDQHEVLSPEQKTLPKIFIEHDPPWQHPADERHPVEDPAVTVVHVTHFNALMWNNQGYPTRVIPHGVLVPDLPVIEKKNRGIVVINNLSARGRMLGADIFERVAAQVPLDLVGMGTENLGLGEVLHPQLPAFISGYRFFFNPIRYTSLGLSICEAMMCGLPIVGLATTELATTIESGYSGYIHTDVDYLIDRMKFLLEYPAQAEKMGDHAKQVAREKFSIERFASDWNSLFTEVIERSKIKSI